MNRAVSTAANTARSTAHPNSRLDFLKITISFLLSFYGKSVPKIGFFARIQNKCIRTVSLTAANVCRI